MVQSSSNKKGTIAWEYVAAAIIGLVVILIVILFSVAIREKVLEGFRYFIENVLGRR